MKTLAEEFVHHPLPWRVDETYSGGIRDMNGFDVVLDTPERIRPGIIVAVNFHDRLVAVMERLLEAADVSNCDSCRCDEARAVLADIAAAARKEADDGR